MPVNRLAAGLATTLVFSSLALSAAPTQVSVLLDVDRNSATGCTANAFSGAEKRLVITIDGGAVPSFLLQGGNDFGKDDIRDKVRPMAKVTSKYQVTIPKVLAEKLGIEPGHDIDWSASGDSIRLTPSHTRPSGLTRQLRLDLFDEATRRQRRRQKRRPALRGSSAGRGWRREDLYDRGRTR